MQWEQNPAFLGNPKIIRIMAKKVSTSKSQVKVKGAESKTKPLKTAMLHRDLLAALRENRGHISRSCEQCGVDRGAYYDAMKDPDFARAIEYMKEGELDDYEEALRMMRDAMLFPAVKYKLDAHGKARGYGAQEATPPPANNPAASVDVKVNFATLPTEVLLQLKAASLQGNGKPEQKAD